MTKSMRQSAQLSTQQKQVFSFTISKQLFFVDCEIFLVCTTWTYILYYLTSEAVQLNHCAIMHLLLAFTLEQAFFTADILTVIVGKVQVLCSLQVYMYNTRPWDWISLMEFSHLLIVLFTPMSSILTCQNVFCKKDIYFNSFALSR